jgi:hypothetical protein
VVIAAAEIAATGAAEVTAAVIEVAEIAAEDTNYEKTGNHFPVFSFSANLRSPMPGDPSPSPAGLGPMPADPLISFATPFPMTLMPLISSANPYPIARDPYMFTRWRGWPLINNFHRPLPNHGLHRAGTDKPGSDKDRNSDNQLFHSNYHNRGFKMK